MGYAFFSVIKCFQKLRYVIKLSIYVQCRLILGKTNFDIVYPQVGFFLKIRGKYDKPQKGRQSEEEK